MKVSGGKGAAGSPHNCSFLCKAGEYFPGLWSTRLKTKQNYKKIIILSHEVPAGLKHWVLGLLEDMRSYMMDLGPNSEPSPPGMIPSNMAGSKWQ